LYIAHWPGLKLEARLSTQPEERWLAAGAMFCDEQIAGVQRWCNDTKQKWNSMAERERQVLQALSEGLDNKAIANNLDVSQKTIKKHLNSMYAKLGVTTRTEAALLQGVNARYFST
jgi:DNA-binding NarL/FixJ family response regulator